MPDILSQEEIDALLEAIEKGIVDDPTSISPERFTEITRKQQKNIFMKICKVI